MSYVITGNPGVGKHTIAKEINKILQKSIIDINNIALEFGLFEKNGNTNDVDVKKLKDIFKEKLSSQDLIVGHLAPYVLSSKQIKKVFILRKNPRDLITIYKQRKYSKEKIKDNLGSEVLGIILHDAITEFGKEKIFQINVTGKNVEKITKQIMDSIKGKIKDDDVDWLSSITEENELKEFFAY